MHASTRGQCFLALRQPKRAVAYASKSLDTLDSSFVRNVAMTTLDLADAYVELGDVDEAARFAGEAGELAARNRSARLAGMLHTTPTRMQPWQDTEAVRRLDERLDAYGLRSSGRT